VGIAPRLIHENKLSQLDSEARALFCALFFPLIAIVLAPAAFLLRYQWLVL
jgi:hypothetical protein